MHYLYKRLHFIEVLGLERTIFERWWKKGTEKYKNKYIAGSHFKSGSITTADFPLESNDILISLQKIYYPVHRVIQHLILLLRMGKGLSKVLAMHSVESSILYLF